VVFNLSLTDVLTQAGETPRSLVDEYDEDMSTEVALSGYEWALVRVPEIFASFRYCRLAGSFGVATAAKMEPNNPTPASKSDPNVLLRCAHSCLNLAGFEEYCTKRRQQHRVPVRQGLQPHRLSTCRLGLACNQGDVSQL
jgi:hypothetical protein